MLSEHDLVKGCKEFSSIAQKELYARYECKMRGVCLRYTVNYAEAQDILQEGFIKVFSNIHTYSGVGSLEGWIRKIMVNTAITAYHKNKKIRANTIDFERTDIPDGEENNDDNCEEKDEFNIILQANLSKEDLLNSLKTLSDAYRIVFNMYYVENYSHKEIAKVLNIDETTCRTRLFKAKKQLQKYLCTFCTGKVKTVSR